MDKIEVGEWIRTNNGIVDRIKDIIETRGDRKLIAFEKMNTYKSDIGIEKWVKTHSKNKIGIVEKGDYVNGMEVDEFDDEEGNIYLGFPIYTDACMDCIEEVRPLSSIEIEDIVTHEQFESVKYNF